MSYDVSKKITMGDLKTALNKTKDYTDNAIAEAELSAPSGYYPAGSVSFDNLPTAGIANLGAVYNITNSFTTTADFLEGAGLKYPAGTNVSVVKDGDNYKYDVYVGAIDVATPEEINEMLDDVFGPAETD